MLGGLFGVFSERKLGKDLFLGIDYHSHLGTEIGGLAFLDDQIKLIFHDISNSQFRSDFQKDQSKIKGVFGIGVISDEKDEQPIKFESQIDTFALCTAGIIRNSKNLYNELIEEGASFKKSRIENGKCIPNQTEIVGELISKGENIVDGIERMYKKIEGTVSLLLLSKKDNSIYASGDTFPLIVGNREQDWAIASETSAFPNLGYKTFKFLDYREIISIDNEGLKQKIKTNKHKKFCPFLHIYFGFPTSDYYGVNAEIVRERCGGFLAENDNLKADLTLGIADSGFAHSIGYVKRKIELAKEKTKIVMKQFTRKEINTENLEKSLMNIVESIAPLRRPLIKYTPGWGRSYIPPTQEMRTFIARYKQISNPHLIKNMRIVLVDDSIRRGTQLQDLLSEKIWPYNPREIHGRIASPPQIHPCIYDLSTKIEDLATCKALTKIGKDFQVNDYLDEKSPEYIRMVDEIAKMIGFTSLKFLKLEDLISAVVEAPGNAKLQKQDLCLYCWTGKY